jgi:hypothetical protein
MAHPYSCEHTITKKANEQNLDRLRASYSRDFYFRMAKDEAEKQRLKGAFLK